MRLSHQGAELPLKLFEVGDVALLDSSKDVGARNNRRIGVIHGGTTSGFEIVHGYVLLDIMLRSSLILMWCSVCWTVLCCYATSPLKVGSNVSSCLVPAIIFVHRGFSGGQTGCW